MSLTSCDDFALIGAPSSYNEPKNYKSTNMVKRFKLIKKNLNYSPFDLKLCNQTDKNFFTLPQVNSMNHSIKKSKILYKKKVFRIKVNDAR
jgi:hypothetical protein